MKVKFIVAMVGMMQIAGHAKSQSYFPPKTGVQWDTIKPDRLGWCEDSLQALYQFLDQKNTKAFLVLKGGKMVIEKYFDAFQRDSFWYWASAGKSLAAALVGVAQQEQILDIHDSVSKYLGKGWTQCSDEQEGKIQVVHQISMSTGLNDIGIDVDCTADSCLTYLTEPGSRWAYHNAPYHLVHQVIESASGMSLNAFTSQKIGQKIGLAGLWIDHVFYSNARNMARFGLLMLNKGNWAGDQILTDTQYFKEMINTSQSHNLSYGYLWWLNGKNSYMPPRVQLKINGSLIPQAPADLYAAMGKNDQKLYIIPSQDLVIVRLGEETGAPTLGPSSFDGGLWERISRLACSTASAENNSLVAYKIYPNPVTELLHIDGMKGMGFIEVYDGAGKKVAIIKYNEGKADVSQLQTGLYIGVIEGKHLRFLRM